VGANFINLNPSSTETLKEYDMQFSEHGTNFTQKVKLDKDNGLIIYEVPAHGNRVATKFVYDDKAGLMLSIASVSGTCTLHRAFYAVGFDQMESNLETASIENDSTADRLDLNPESATIYDLTEILSENPVERECIPENLRQHIPEDFVTYLSRQVQLGKENIHERRGNASQRYITDPLTQKNYNVGDEVELFEDVFDVLPPCAFTRSSRVKRECRKPDGTLVDRCLLFRGVKCENGCQALHVGYDCNIRDWNCHMVLVCDIVKGNKCIAHIGDSRNTCRKCCRTANCGQWLRQCEYMGEDDTCPPAGVGCPFTDVRIAFKGPKSYKRCFTADCETIMSENGNENQSGVECSTGTRKRNEAEFCCDNPNATSDLKSCAPRS
jgi:hypothetical protein